MHMCVLPSYSHFDWRLTVVKELWLQKKNFYNRLVLPVSFTTLFYVLSYILSYVVLRTFLVLAAKYTLGDYQVTCCHDTTVSIW